MAESRNWKESVGRETERLNRHEVLAYFDPNAVRIRFRQALERSRQQGASEKVLIYAPPRVSLIAQAADGLHQTPKLTHFSSHSQA